MVPYDLSEVDRIMERECGEVEVVRGAFAHLLYEGVRPALPVLEKLLSLFIRHISDQSTR